jgi:amino acid transporter
VTVWVFIGMEGASVYSARVRKREDVGRATAIGCLTCLLLLMPVSPLSRGVFNQPTLAGLKNPSMARELEADVLVIATDVAAVCLDWGQPTHRALGKVTPHTLGEHNFAAGSMGPRLKLRELVLWLAASAR